MSIDGQIKGLEYLKKCGIFPFSDTRTGIIFTDECIDGAVDTMRKYQKIQEIVEHWACCGNPSDSMIAISEVVEDGNDKRK